MPLSGGDHAWVVYQGPPRWDGEKYVDGDHFFLSGHHRYMRNHGVELAKGITGLEREVSRYLFDRAAETPGGNYQGSVSDPREIASPINIHGDSPAEIRENKRRWFDNHPDGNPGRLWAFTADGEPRYLPVMKSETAGTGAIDKDPTYTNGYNNLEWGWISESPYFLGYRQEYNLKAYGGYYRRHFYNPSTVPQIYYQLFLPGPGQWEFSLGFEQGKFTTPELFEGEEARIDFDPTKATFMKRDVGTNNVSNLWPYMMGQRPEVSLEAQTKNTVEVFYSGLGTEKEKWQTRPRIAFTPKFISWT